jgi:hypothetical protein
VEAQREGERRRGRAAQGGGARQEGGARQGGGARQEGGARREGGARQEGGARERSRRLARAAGGALALALVAITPGGTALAADVLTQHNDNSRTGVNAAETALTTANVKPDTFGKLWTLYVDGQVVAQPLYLSQLPIDTRTNPGTPPLQGTFNALLVATMHNTVYLYDADQENRLLDGKTKPLWATWLGQPRPSGKDIDMWSTNDPEWGILGTPVVDPQKTTAWVVAWHSEGGKSRYRLHALNLRDGAQRTPAVLVGGEPPDANRPCQYPGGAFNPCTQKQRAGLLLDKGILYVAFGGDGSRGAVFAYDAATLQPRGMWSVTPTGGSGGIWQSGQGPAADADGNVFLITGNGTFDADRGGKNFGDSFVRLRLENGALTVKDYFTPCNQKFMADTDLDLGAGGAVLIPGTQLLIGGGKEGVIYLLSRTNLGKYAASPDAPNCTNPNVLQQFQATDLHIHGAATTYGHVHSSPVFWKRAGESRVYVWGENDRLKQFRFSGNKFVATAQPKKSTYQPPPGMPGGMLSLSTNGTRAETGIVWAAVPLDGDANKNRGVQGIVVAVDAQDVSRQLWTSELSGPRDRLGLFAKYQPPTVAGGKVFVATYGDAEQRRVYGGNDRPTQFPRYNVAVYGLLPREHTGKPIVDQSSDDVTVLKASATTPLTLDPAACVPGAPGTIDCTAALEKKLGAPSLHVVTAPVGSNFAGCSLLRVTTASKQAAVTDATGIGWYAADAAAGNQAMTSGRFIATAALKQVGTATLKSGAPALLHEFVGVAGCPAGQGSFDRLFKPFMQFDNAPDKTFRNWDRADNYRIGRAVLQFDRSATVLQGP